MHKSLALQQVLAKRLEVSSILAFLLVNHSWRTNHNRYRCIAIGGQQWIMSLSTFVALLTNLTVFSVVLTDRQHTDRRAVLFYSLLMCKHVRRIWKCEHGYGVTPIWTFRQGRVFSFV